MFRQERNFKNSRELKLSAIFEGENRDAPVVVMCHGFHSSKDNPITSRTLAQKLVENGLSVLRFDFTGHGQSEGDIDEVTPLIGLDDVKCAIKTLNNQNFALYGSSFGGYISLLYASQNPVLTLALKAPVSDWCQVQISKERGKRFCQETKNINIYQKAKNIKAPTLIIHGDKDDVVPLSQSKELFRALKGDKRLEIIRGTDHDIRGEDLEKANTKISDFFRKILIK